jgi:hypothetical protein
MAQFNWNQLINYSPHLPLRNRWDTRSASSAGTAWRVKWSLTPASFYRTGDSYAKVPRNSPNCGLGHSSTAEREIHCDAFIVRINHLIYRQIAVNCPVVQTNALPHRTEAKVR